MVALHDQVISDDLFWNYIDEVKRWVITEVHHTDNVVGAAYTIEFAFACLEPSMKTDSSQEAISLYKEKITQDQFLDKISSLIINMNTNEIIAAFYIFSELGILAGFDTDQFLYFCLYIIVMGRDKYYAAIHDRKIFEDFIQADLERQLFVSALDYLDYLVDDHAHFYHRFLKNKNAKIWLSQCSYAFRKLNESQLSQMARDIYPRWYLNSAEMRQNYNWKRAQRNRVLKLIAMVLVSLVITGIIYASWINT